MRRRPTRSTRTETRVPHSTLFRSSLQKYSVYYTLAGAATNISLKFLFIPRYVAVGAAWATLATQIGILPIQLAFRRGRGNFFMMLNAVAAPARLLRAVINASTDRKGTRLNSSH